MPTPSIVSEGGDLKPVGEHVPALSPLWACSSLSRTVFILSWEKQLLPPLPPLGIGLDHRLERTCGDRVVPKY